MPHLLSRPNEFHKYHIYESVSLLTVLVMIILLTIEGPPSELARGHTSNMWRAQLSRHQDPTLLNKKWRGTRGGRGAPET